jgi:hypothetical protein
VKGGVRAKSRFLGSKCQGEPVCAPPASTPFNLYAPRTSLHFCSNIQLAHYDSLPLLATHTVPLAITLGTILSNRFRLWTFVDVRLFESPFICGPTIFVRGPWPHSSDSRHISKGRQPPHGKLSTDRDFTLRNSAGRLPTAVTAWHVAGRLTGYSMTPHLVLT